MTSLDSQVMFLWIFAPGGRLIGDVFWMISDVFWMVSDVFWMISDVECCFLDDGWCILDDKLCFLDDKWCVWEAFCTFWYLSRLWDMKSEAFHFEKSFEHSPKASKRLVYPVFNDFNVNNWHFDVNHYISFKKCRTSTLTHDFLRKNIRWFRW